MCCEVVFQRELAKSTSRAEISSPTSLFLYDCKRAQIGSALTGATSELKKPNCEKISQKRDLNVLQRNLDVDFLSLVSLYT